MKYIILLLCFTVSGFISHAQNYSAIHGSNYSGSLGVYNNPSSIVNVPYKWDVTLFGFQFQTISNAVKGPNFPFNLSRSGEYYAADGNYKRYGDLNFNLRLLNTRISLNEQSAIAFGMNLRGYTQANTSRVNYNDSVLGPRSFLSSNEANRTLDLKGASSAWLELYGSYARTLWNNETSRLHAGGSLKIMRSMAGAFAEVNGVGIESGTQNDITVYKVTGGSGRYGYSDNLDDNGSLTADNLFSGQHLGLSFDLGMEYLIKTQAVTSVFDEDADHDYEWKIGFSLLDLGINKFNYSPESRSAGPFRADVTSQVLNEKFYQVDDVRTFNDSVSTIVDNFDTLQGNFRIMNPARAVLNVDRYLTGNFFLNAELSVNLSSDGNNRFAVKESRFLTVTPRWETKKLGFYMPVQVTRHGNFWIGGAVKAGPLLLGTHNLLNAFSKNKYVAGGAYIALTIRPMNIIRTVRSRQYDCPEL